MQFSSPYSFETRCQLSNTRVVRNHWMVIRRRCRLSAVLHDRVPSYRPLEWYRTIKMAFERRCSSRTVILPPVLPAIDHSSGTGSPNGVRATIPYPTMHFLDRLYNSQLLISDTGSANQTRPGGHSHVQRHIPNSRLRIPDQGQQEIVAWRSSGPDAHSTPYSIKRLSSYQPPKSYSISPPIRRSVLATFLLSATVLPAIDRRSDTAFGPRIQVVCAYAAMLGRGIRQDRFRAALRSGTVCLRGEEDRV